MGHAKHTSHPIDNYKGEDRKDGIRKGKKITKRLKKGWEKIEKNNK